MKITAFVPIKLNNERVPGKNLKIFHDGRTVISFTLEKLENLIDRNIIDEAIVYCSQELIKDYLPEKIRWIKRSVKLDTNETRSNDIIEAFISDCDSDIYVMCHATAPFMGVDKIEKCICAVKNGEYDSAFSAKKIQNFLWQEEKPLNFSVNNYPRTQDLKPIYEELPTPYVFTKRVFELTGGRAGYNPFICECSDIEGIDIDTQDDFKLAYEIHKAGLDSILA